MLDELYRSLEDPTYEGNPVETLFHIDEMLGEYDSRFKLEGCLEVMEPDPGLFPEDTGFDIATLLTPEALDTEPLCSFNFNSTMYLRRMRVSESDHPISLILSLTPRIAPRTRISQVGAGAEFP